MSKKVISNEKATKELKKGFNNAKSIAKDERKLEKFINRFSESWKSNTFAKDVMNNIELLFSLVKDYKNGVYKEVPLGTIVAIISALVYVINPFDLIPDAIPGIGQIDDAAVVVACIKLIQNDLEKYKEWLNNNKGTNKTSKATKMQSKKSTSTCKKQCSKNTKSAASKSTSKKRSPSKKATTKK